MIKELTKAEEEIMQILWEIEKGFVNDIVAKMPEPKPAYTTISTVIRILENKGFVAHKAFGKTHEYYPLILKNDYAKEYMSNVVKNYFSNSFHQMVSFFTNENKLSIKELEEIKKLINDEIKKKSK